MPQMSPMLWVVFPVVIMVLGVVVMVLSEKEEVEIWPELLESLSVDGFEW